MAVTTADGRVLRAKYALLTASLGALKAGGIAFTPALPAFKSKAIAEMVREGREGAGGQRFPRLAYVHSFTPCLACFLPEALHACMCMPHTGQRPFSILAPNHPPSAQLASFPAPHSPPASQGMGLLDKTVLVFPQAFWDSTDFIVRETQGWSGRWSVFLNWNNIFGQMPVIVAIHVSHLVQLHFLGHRQHEQSPTAHPHAMPACAMLSMLWLLL